MENERSEEEKSNGKGCEANSKGWWHLAIKKLLPLFRGITSKHYRDWIYCLNGIHSFRTKTKLESHKKVCRNKDFCNIIMHSENNKLL